MDTTEMQRITRDYYKQWYASKIDNLEQMNKCLQRYSLPRLNQEDIENMNRLITSTEIETGIKKLPTNKSPGPDGFTGEFYQTFREELTVLLSLPRNCRERNTPILTVWGHHHPDTKYRPISLMNKDTKILNKILANWIQQYFKRIRKHDQVGFIPEK